MSQWDRKILLTLVVEAGQNLQDPDLSVAQRDSLQALLAHYGNKAKSIHANHLDVQSLQGQLDQILGQTDCAA